MPVMRLMVYVWMSHSLAITDLIAKELIHECTPDHKDSIHTSATVLMFGWVWKSPWSRTLMGERAAGYKRLAHPWTSHARSIMIHLQIQFIFGFGSGGSWIMWHVGHHGSG